MNLPDQLRQVRSGVKTSNSFALPCVEMRPHRQRSRCSAGVFDESGRGRLFRAACRNDRALVLIPTSDVAQV